MNTLWSGFLILWLACYFALAILFGVRVASDETQYDDPPLPDPAKGDILVDDEGGTSDE